LTDQEIGAWLVHGELFSLVSGELISCKQASILIHSYGF
jgi:hypothetical protein